MALAVIGAWCCPSCYTLYQCDPPFPLGWPFHLLLKSKPSALSPKKRSTEHHRGRASGGTQKIAELTREGYSKLEICAPAYRLPARNRFLT